MSGVEKIQVTGLKELRAGLKAQGPLWPKALQKTNKALANMIVGPAKGLMGGHSPHAGGRAAGTIRALASGTRAQVAVGSGSVPWAIGHEFGSNLHHQFPPHLGRTGYAVYPTIRAMRAQITDMYGDMIDELVQDAGIAE